MLEVAISGVGMTTFGRHLDRSLRSLSEEALGAALADSGLRPEDVDVVYYSNSAAGLITGQEMIRGEVALREMPLGGVPMVNVDNACASGGTAAHLAWMAVASGYAETAVAVGAEKLFHEDKSLSFAAIESGTDLSVDLGDPVEGSIMMSAYAAKARGFASRHGAIDDALADIAIKNRRHAGANERAQFTKAIDRDDVAASRVVAEPLHLLTCSPLTDGAAAAVFRRADQGEERAVEIKATVLRSYSTEGEIARRAADAAYAQAGTTAEEVSLFALHDACAFAELQQYEQIGIAGPGAAPELVAAGQTAIGGRFPVNTDGGLMSRGHALGATGLAQLFELVTQLRGEAGERQVTGADRAFALNCGGWMGDDYAAASAVVLEKGIR
jgi:acetyl-CoA acetyltransferase